MTTDNITLEDVHNMLYAGFIVLSANMIRNREPEKSFDACRAEALFQMQDTIADLGLKD